jgi:predicted Zn-dependent protease
MKSEIRIGSWGILLFCLLAAPAHADLINIGVGREKKLGAQAAEQIEQQVDIRYDRVSDQIERIGKRLVEALGKSDFEYRFRVIDMKEINAFALPGGYIYVFTGLAKAAKTEDEIAAVLAHEIIHAHDHHWANQYEKQFTRDILITGLLMATGAGNLVRNIADLLNFAVGQRYSRKDEQSSDDKGMELMAAAGYNPEGMIRLLENLGAYSKTDPKLLQWMSDHPQIPRRIERAKERLTTLKERGSVKSGNGEATSDR